MTKTWIVSDTHFGHHNIYKFVNLTTGESLRPWADDADQGDEIMRETWNSRVGPNDKVYHLGDVAIPRRGLASMAGLNGRKILVRGNHDIFKLNDYAEYFDDVRGTHKLDRFILTHYPIHHLNIPEWCKGIVHGHTHSNMVLRDDGERDQRYANVCIEHTDRGPVEFEQIREYFSNLNT